MKRQSILQNVKIKITRLNMVLKLPQKESIMLGHGDDILSIREACCVMRVGKGALYTLFQPRRLKGY